MTYGLDYSPDGSLLASANNDGFLRLWRTDTGTRQAPSSGHQDQVFGVAFDGRGQSLASGSADGTVRIWDVLSGEQRLSISGHLSEVYGVSYSPDGNHIASAGGDRTVRLWHADTGREAAVLSGHDAAVLALAFSPDGGTLATSGVGSTVRLWDTATGRQRGSVLSSARGVYALAFHPAGEWLAAGGEGGVQIWDAATGAAIAQLAGEDPGWIWDVDFSADGGQLAAATDHDGVRIWEVATGESRTLGDAGRRFTSVDFHPARPNLAAASADGTARIWDLEGDDEVVLRGHRDEINRIRLSADGQRLVTSSTDNTLQLWDAATGLPCWRAPMVTTDPPRVATHAGWTALGGEEASTSNPAAGWRQEVQRRARHAAISDDGALVCVRRNDDRLTGWRTADDTQFLSHEVAGLESVAAAHGGCYAATAAGRLTFHPADGTEPREIHDPVTAFRPEAGQLLVAADGEIRVHAPDGPSLESWPAGRGVTALARLGGAVVVGYSDGHIERRDPTVGPWPFDLDGVPAAEVTRLEAGPEGTLVAGYADGSLGLWSLENGYQLHRVDLHGPVAHLVRVGDTLHAVTALGDRYAMDLTVFDRPYCDLLHEVWAQVPVVWATGAASRQSPQRPHACLD